MVPQENEVWLASAPIPRRRLASAFSDKQPGNPIALTHGEIRAAIFRKFPEKFETNFRQS